MPKSSQRQTLNNLGSESSFHQGGLAIPKRKNTVSFVCVCLRGTGFWGALWFLSNSGGASIDANVEGRVCSHHSRRVDLRLWRMWNIVRVGSVLEREQRTCLLSKTLRKILFGDVWWWFVYFNCFGSSKRCKKQQLPTFYRIISTLQIVRLLYVVFVVPWTRTFPLYLCLTACILIVLTGCVCVLPFKGDGSPERIDNLSSWNSFKVSTCAIPSPQHSIVAPKRNPGWM